MFAGWKLSRHELRGACPILPAENLKTWFTTRGLFMAVMLVAPALTLALAPAAA